MMADDNVDTVSQTLLSVKVFTDHSDTITVTTTRRGRVEFTPVEQLAWETDFV